MEQRPDIWRHLQDHATPPPAEVFESLRHLLGPDREEKAAAHDDLATGPKPAANEPIAVFRRLETHPVTPPAHLRPAIIEAAMPAGHHRMRTIRPYITAAACVLFVVVGFVVYRATHTRPAAVVRNNTPAIRSSTTNDTLTRSATAATTADPTGPSAGMADSNVASAGDLLPSSISLDGARFALTDNNLLATFTGFHYPSLGSHVNNKLETSLHIRLDQYTNITLSPAITSTLRDLYGTRPDGTPDRKARKTREKLEKWDGEDKKQFDLRYNMNPLDPVDLAEFLYPPLFSFGRHSGEPITSTGTAAPASTASTSPAPAAPLTVSYTLTLMNKKTTIGIAETYNGGIQTLFDDGEHARLRLASLMRIQSIFMNPGNASLTIVTESTRPRNSVAITAAQWSHYNDKYAGATRDLADDTVSILGYRCKKALIRLHDGRRISAWYTPRIQTPAQGLLEPAFAGIPGLVLRYDYTCRRKTIRYTATSLSRQSIDASVFSLPSTP